MNPYFALTLGSLPVIALVAWSLSVYVREMRRLEGVRAEALRWSKGWR